MLTTSCSHTDLFIYYLFFYDCFFMIVFYDCFFYAAVQQPGRNVGRRLVVVKSNCSRMGVELTTVLQAYANGDRCFSDNDSRRDRHRQL